MIATSWCNGSASYQAEPNGTVVTIGNFDGVHLGHQALLQRTLQCASEMDASPCVFTLDPPPMRLLRPETCTPRLQTLPEKAATLRDLGVEAIVVERFNAAFADLSAEGFARDILGRRLQAKAVVVGWNFRFGKGRQGTVADLERWLGIPVYNVEPVLVDGVAVSSSRIRAAIQAGELGQARRLLGRRYAIRGVVEQGSARGRTLGFPTANVNVAGRLLPPHGVYAVLATLPDGEVKKAVANLGERPTFGQHPPNLEVHLLDWSGDLYGQPLTVTMTERLRDEQTFANPSALREQIEVDIARARDVLR